MSHTTLSRFTGLELPVWGEYESRHLLRKPDEFKAAADGNDPYFIRSTRLLGLGFNCLKTCLEITDQELGLAADLCGANVVDHQWGLVPRTEKDTDDCGRLVYPEHLVPKGYILGAMVSVVHDAVPIRYDRAERADICQGVAVYNERSADYSLATLQDITPSQFVLQPSQSGGYDRWLVDIEPRFNGYY